MNIFHAVIKRQGRTLHLTRRTIRSRAKTIDIAKESFYDILIIGGGSTGTGAALDCVTRGLRSIVLERADWSSGTSSRSTKLIWGGSRYLAQAFVSLLHKDLRLLRRPLQTLKDFVAEFKMVLNCHRERRFLLEEQPHLTHWIPIAVPLKKWFLWPPPFGFAPAAFGPLGIFPLFFKFYDALSGFSCPPSHIMTPARAKRKFPQLANDEIKYCSIFYEGMHDDARTNLAIARTADREGAAALNYCEVVELLRDEKPKASGASGGRGALSGKVCGAVVKDLLTGDVFTVKAKAVLFCGGPFTDELRRLEDSACLKAVDGASGIHIILPAYFAPTSFGFVDMNTSDGRFLFFLPWEGHVLVGTTDRRCEPTMSPEPAEDEIQWVINEASKYLSADLKIRRQDVLSAWSGIRPLVMDPNKATAGSQAVSRDHVVSHNSSSGTVFVSGGKWTTYREMAQDAVDKVIEVAGLQASGPCRTLQVPLVGKEGYSENLPIQLVQAYSNKISIHVARHLARAYGGDAWLVLELAAMRSHDSGGFELLAPGFPYLEAEVVYSVRHEWAVRAEDVLARRTRLAFLNKTAAVTAVPRVVALMARELGWDAPACAREIKHVAQFLVRFGGPRPASHSSPCASETELANALRCLDIGGRGFDPSHLCLAGALMGEVVSDEDEARFSLFLKQQRQRGQSESSQKSESSLVSLAELVAWWLQRTSVHKATHNVLGEESYAERPHTAIDGSGTLFG